MPGMCAERILSSIASGKVWNRLTALDVINRCAFAPWVIWFSVERNVCRKQ